MTRAELLTKAKPILFNTEMVRAILGGRKTVTRRVIKPQPKDKIVYCLAGYRAGKWGYPAEDAHKYWGKEFKRAEQLTTEEENRYWTPPCHAGDILYARETFRDFCGMLYGRENGAYIPLDDFEGYQYKADNAYFVTKGINPFCDGFEDQKDDIKYGRWHPSIHMPKEAARIFLRVTGVRVERLQDVTIQDLKNEGALYGCYECAHSNDYCGEAATLTQDCRYNSMSGYIYQEKEFELLWDSTIPKKNRELYGWDANPWVWVIEFERVEVQE